MVLSISGRNGLLAQLGRALGRQPPAELVRGRTRASSTARARARCARRRRPPRPHGWPRNARVDDAHQLHVEREPQVASRHRLAPLLGRDVHARVRATRPRPRTSTTTVSSPPGRAGSSPTPLDAAAADRGRQPGSSRSSWRLEILGVDLVQEADRVRAEGGRTDTSARASTTIAHAGSSRLCVSIAANWSR